MQRLFKIVSSCHKLLLLGKTCQQNTVLLELKDFQDSKTCYNSSLTHLAVIYESFQAANYEHGHSLNSFISEIALVGFYSYFPNNTPYIYQYSSQPTVVNHRIPMPLIMWISNAFYFWMIIYTFLAWNIIFTF